MSFSTKTLLLGNAFTIDSCTSSVISSLGIPIWTCPPTHLKLVSELPAVLNAIIIIAKQIKLWFHEHNVKIAILRLHGASILYSASSILNYALLSSLLAFVISASFLYYVSHNMTVLFPLELHDIMDIEINLTLELMKIFLLSFCISIFTIFGVLLKYKINND